MAFPNFPSKEEHHEYLEKFKINQSRAMFTIILSILVDSLGYSLVFPLLPDIARDFGASNFMIGVLISSNALSALICVPIWGKLSDKYGRKPILLISQIGTGISFLILGLSRSYYNILFARILDGAFSGQIPVIRAYVTDITTPQTRASYMGKFMVGYTVGMIAGPSIGGLLGVINWRFPPFLTSSLSIISIILTVKVITESMPKERREEIKIQLLLTQTDPSNKGSIWNEEVIMRLIQTFLTTLISFMFTTSFPIVLADRYGANASIIGSVLVVAGIGLLIYGIILMKPLIRKIGEKNLLLTTFILLFILFIFYPYLSDLWMVYIFILPFAFCMAFMRPLISANIAKAVNPLKQGAVSGWAVNIQSFSQIIAPLISYGFLQLGGLTIGFVDLNSYQLIGFTNVIFALSLFIIGYADLKLHPKLYLYEKLRRKREEIRRRKARTG
ncbi:MAG: MFS transporter [Candidatus Lokiarchaeota archaeon]|nr:MFS transporter [Candidatus Lokiarchaeota archaeon]